MFFRGRKGIGRVGRLLGGGEREEEFNERHFTCRVEERRSEEGRKVHSGSSKPHIRCSRSTSRIRDVMAGTGTLSTFTICIYKVKCEVGGRGL